MPITIQTPVVSLLILCAALLLHFQLGPWPEVLRYPVLGAALFTLGVSLVVWSRIYFMLRKTTLFVGRVSSCLVCEGPFRISRNPMYVGVLTAVLGVAFWIGTWPLFACVAVAFSVLNYFYIPREERMLLEAFGENYIAYCKKARRWL